MFSRIQRGARSVLSLNRPKEFAILRRLLALEPEHRLLDVGCGDGFWTVRFARHAGEVVGVDPDAKLLGYARAHHRRRNLRFDEGSALRLHFPDASFDRVVAVSVVEHFSDPGAGLAEMTRVLAPGGALALSVDSLSPANASTSFRTWHARKHHVHTYFDAASLAAELDLVGLKRDGSPFEEIFTSRLAGVLRGAFIRQIRVLLPLFPLFLAWCSGADVAGLGGRMPGQILIGRAWKV